MIVRKAYSCFQPEKFDISRGIYSDRLDFAEEFTQIPYDTNLRVGHLLDRGQIDAARIEVKFTKARELARLRVAYKFGMIHPRDFTPLAIDFVQRMNALGAEVDSRMSLEIVE